MVASIQTFTYIYVRHYWNIKTGIIAGINDEFTTFGHFVVVFDDVLLSLRIFDGIELIEIEKVNADDCCLIMTKAIKSVYLIVEYKCKCMVLIIIVFLMLYQ